MARIFSVKDLELLGYKDINEKTSSSSHEQPYKIFEATAFAGIRQVTHTFAYLQSSCPKKDAERVANYVSKPDDFFIVTPKSGLSSDVIQSIFRRNGRVNK
jgi:hypothetical protein